MEKKDKPTPKKSPTVKECSEKAMFHNPVASVNDATGYATTSPKTQEESQSLSNLINAPSTPTNR